MMSTLPLLEGCRKPTAGPERRPKSNSTTSSAVADPDGQHLLEEVVPIANAAPLARQTRQADMGIRDGEVGDGGVDANE